METNTSTIKTSSELRAAARAQLKGNWGTAVLLVLISIIICGLPGSGVSMMHSVGLKLTGNLLSILVGGPMALGIVSCFVKLVRNEPFIIEDVFNGFKSFISAFLLQLLIGIFVSLWTILLVIPGIIAAYRYSMAFYIMNDNPGISALDAINASKEMMKGYKWKLFCLHFSFIGWAIAGIFTCGIGYLWLSAYFNTAQANFYQNLKEANLTNSTF